MRRRNAHALLVWALLAERGWLAELLLLRLADGAAAGGRGRGRRLGLAPDIPAPARPAPRPRTCPGTR